MGVKTCSHGVIVTVIYLSELMGCVGLSFIATIAPCEHLHLIPYNPLVEIKKLPLHSHHINATGVSFMLVGMLFLIIW